MSNDVKARSEADWLAFTTLNRAWGPFWGRENVTRQGSVFVIDHKFLDLKEGKFARIKRPFMRPSWLEALPEVYRSLHLVNVDPWNRYVLVAGAWIWLGWDKVKSLFLMTNALLDDFWGAPRMAFWPNGLTKRKFKFLKSRPCLRFGHGARPTLENSAVEFIQCDRD